MELVGAERTLLPGVRSSEPAPVVRPSERAGLQFKQDGNALAELPSFTIDPDMTLVCVQTFTPHADGRPSLW